MGEPSYRTRHDLLPAPGMISSGLTMSVALIGLRVRPKKKDDPAHRPLLEKFLLTECMVNHRLAGKPLAMIRA